MNKYVQLGNKYITHKKMRTALVIISMILASCFLYIVITIAMGEYIHGRKMEENSENWYVKYSNLTEEQKAALANNINVEASVSGLQQIGLEPHDFYYTDTDTGMSSFNLTILETMDQELFSYDIVDGRLPENPGEIMLNERAFYRFGGEKKFGDTIVLDMVKRDYMGSELSRTSWEYVLTGIYSNPLQNEDEWSYYGYALPGTKEYEEMGTFVRFKRKYHWNKDAQELAENIGAKPDKNGNLFELNEALSIYYVQNQFFILMSVGILMLVFLTIYFCMVMVRSLMSTNVIDKLSDYTVLKSMGATNRQLRRIFMRENFIDGVIAYLGGIALGQILLRVGLNRIVVLDDLHLEYAWAALLFNAFFLWLTIELASIEPFFMLKKSTIIDIIGKRDMVKKAGKKGKKEKKPGPIYKRMRIESQYAYKNMMRNKKSFWNPVASFTLSIFLATTLLMSIYTISYYIGIGSLAMPVSFDNYPYDITAYYSDNSDEKKMDGEKLLEAEKAIEARPDVKTVDKMAQLYLWQSVESKTLRLPSDVPEIKQYGDDMTFIAVLTKGELEKLNEYLLDGQDAYEMLKDGGVLVQTKFIDYSGDEHILFDVKPGDTIMLQQMDQYVRDTTKENKSITKKSSSLFEPMVVKGTVSASPFGYHPMSLIMSYDYLLKAYGQEFLDAHTLGCYIEIDEDTFNEEDFDIAMAKESAFSGWQYMDVSKTIESEIGVYFILGYFIVGFIMFLGILSMLNTMVNEQLQRRKENGILRAIGLSRSGLNRMLIMEKAWIGIVSWVIGTALGIFFSWLLTMAELYDMGQKFKIAWHVPCITLAVMAAVIALLSWLTIITVGKLDISMEVRNQD